ncbi:hypothetical protein LMIY3S_04411 [Labrys miyagiensis]
MRLMAMHTWPMLRKLRRTAPFTAAARSALGATSSGQLPPSSSDTDLMPPMVRKISSPTLSEPVKAILSTSGWETSAWPVAGPSPLTRFTTPAGRPASSRHVITPMAESGVHSEGFTTIVQPAARPAPSFQPISSTG